MQGTTVQVQTYSPTQTELETCPHIVLLLPLPWDPTMLSTANPTWARTLTHTRTLELFVVAATIRQVGTSQGVPKNETFSLSNKFESHTQTRTCPTAHCD